MAGIPPALETDAEDVAWALQTAEALWKRNERVDAIVWLRRAAQSAGEAEDDDRALVLARGAAELSDWIAQHASDAGAAPSAPPGPGSGTQTAAQAIDDLLFASQPDAGEIEEITAEVRVSELPVESIPIESVRSAPPQPRPPPPPAMFAPEHPSTTQETAPLVFAEAGLDGDRASSVPTAAEKHAGMLDPWAESEAPTRHRETERPVVAVAAASFEPDEVVTSAPAVPPPVPRKPSPSPPPLPPVSAPPRPAAAPSPLPPPAFAPSPAPAPPPPPAPPSRRPGPASKPSAPPTTGVDLSDVEALSDLPDDARAAFAKAATVQQLARNDEVAGFALALVLDGSVDVSATIVDVAVRRLERGAVLRARGTIDHVSPVRVVAASGSARVATWDEAAVGEAFRTCPWVEDDLRAAGDRVQAEIGLTMGPLGERLDPSMLADVTAKLTLRVLEEHEVYATRGKLIPGLLVVGAGEIELVGDDEAVTGVLQGGDFLFPSEVLSHAAAPATARAAKGGALVLFAERAAAQELLVTCPPLLEIFAGG